jgi:pimeloyl-ACP methyl ester carboxylesterase
MSQLLKLTGEIAERHASVVFFHGLGGDVYGTWRLPTDSGSLWPLWLARDIPGLAVYSVGYEASISRLHGEAMHLTERAKNLLERLLAEPELQDGPLILIGHSLGGLIIKRLLRIADSEARNRTEAASLLRRVKKVAFLATPHTGSGLASWADRLRILVCPSAATGSLVRNDPNLRDLNLWYRDWASSFGIAHLILAETRPTTILGMVVKPDSSDPGITGSRPVPIDANHSEICKPEDRSSDVYVQVHAFIQRRIEASAPEEMPAEGIFRDAYNFQAKQVTNLTQNITINIAGAEMDRLEALKAVLSAIEPKIAKPSQEQKE